MGQCLSPYPYGEPDSEYLNMERSVRRFSHFKCVLRTNLGDGISRTHTLLNKHRRVNINQQGIELKPTDPDCDTNQPVTANPSEEDLVPLRISCFVAVSALVNE